MNKSELIEAIAQDAEITKAAAKSALESFIKHVTETLSQENGKVSLVGFGTFSVSERAARQGINPSTKQPIEIPAKMVAKFKPGAELAEAVDSMKKKSTSKKKK
ncbi:DNA-binding protein HU-beta [Cruoricaptor ignavus]|uniref:DNA-binding protein HU-beta n=1 Tax=Cruoricaptor ignavus TaxID=1118202 RepID=A0A1M6F817_9FLAO|nr:HU family DNA-binding protein [Cruoricaptor ignavus]SHI93796.1 DNA-binding protein HU-beta [Cruoricaptor ignavus]